MDPRSLQDLQSEGFNKLPLAKQMNHLPDVPVKGRPAPILIRGGGNPPLIQRTINDLPLARQMDMLPSHGGVPSSRQAISQTIEQGTINNLPLVNQMDMLPSRGLSPSGGVGIPVQAEQVPFHEQPLFKQMEKLSETPTEAPITTRGADPRWRDTAQVDAEVVDEPQWPTRGAQDAEFEEIPAEPKASPIGLPEASSTQLGASTILEDLPSRVPDMTLEERMSQMANPQTEESVVNYTDKTPEPEIEDVIGHDPSESSIMDAVESQGMPLGKPRVNEWKAGQGPSDELIGQLRDAEGSKSAAHRLAIPQKEVTSRAPRMSPRDLPPDVKTRIATALEGMSPEEKLTYLASAPNGLTEAFIKSQMGQ